MIGAADPLQQTARAFGCADMNDEIDVAPVDAEIERRRRDDGAEFAGRHRGFDFFTLCRIKRTVMQADRQIVVIAAPEFLKDILGLHARIDENQR